MAIFGLLNGSFDLAQIAENAAAKHVHRMRLGDRTAYCSEPKVAEACLTLLDNSLAAFGDRESLQQLIEVQEGRRGNLGAEQRFTRLIHAARQNAAIWGIATGPAIVDGLLAWTPGRDQMQVKWTKVFERVEAMTYQTKVGDRLHVAIRIECDTADSARTISILLQGLQGVQAMLWEVQAPGRPNPLAAMEVSSDSKICLLRLIIAAKTLTESALFPVHTTAN